jgi:hypothetical protein
MTVTDYKLYIVNPSAATNLCTNPSFETGTTGWTTGGTNTIATSAVQQRRGVYSCKCTYTDNDLLASYAITLTDTDHVASMDIYIPSTYTGTQLTLTWTGFTSGTVVAGLADMTIKDHWQRVHCHINPDSGDLAGTLTLSETGTNGSAGEFIYVDGVQIEAGTAETTYFDGDSEGFLDNVLEYYWTGQANASTSVRTANTRSGGLLVDIENYCKIIMTDGLGIAPVDNVAIALTKGGERFLYSNLTARYFNVRVVFKGTEIGTIQSNRKAFVNLIKPDKTAYNQPLVIRYQGIDDNGNQESDPVNIVCQYVSGLDQSPVMKFAHFADLTFRLSGTALEVDGDAGVGLDYNDTLANANYIVKRDRDGVWSAMAGVTGTVYAIAQHPITKEIYIGGNFLNAGGDPDADYLARWNGSAWVSVVAGMNGYVRDLIFDNAGNLYMGGLFTSLGDADGDRIVKLGSDGTTLTSLGTGLNSICRKIVIDNAGNLYVGGNFTLAGGVANTAYIAKWDGSVWTPLSTGLSDYVTDIVIDKNDNLYIVGGFTNAGGANGDYVVKWTGSAWESLGTGSNAILHAAALDNAGNLYVGGAATTLGGVTVGKCGRWNGNKWEALGSGTNNTIYSFLTKDNKFYIGGDFTTAGDVSLLDRIAVYLGNGIYQSLDINLPGTTTAYGLFFDNIDNLYVGFGTSGNAETAGDDIITNSGTATTYPIITVTGPGLLRQIVNTTTGKGIYFNNLTLLAGEVITMDLRPDKLTMVSTFRGNIKSYLLKGSNLDFPLIPGANRIATFIDGTTTAATAATMKWKPMLHGLDGAQYE